MYGSWKYCAVGVSIMGHHYYMLQPLCHPSSFFVGNRQILGTKQGWIFTSSIGSRVSSTIYHLPQNASMSCSSGFTSVRLLAATVDTQHSVARSMAPSVFFWTAFYMFFNIKSWQLHLILFMEMLSHVFLLKSLWVENPCVLPLIFKCSCGIQTVLQWVCCHRHCIYLQPLQISWSLSYKPLGMLETGCCKKKNTQCKIFFFLLKMWKSNSYEVITVSPIRQTISSHSLMVLARSATQQKPVDWGVSGESLWTEPIICLDNMWVQPMTTAVMAWVLHHVIGRVWPKLSGMWGASLLDWNMLVHLTSPILVSATNVKKACLDRFNLSPQQGNSLVTTAQDETSRGKNQMNMHKVKKKK